MDCMYKGVGGGGVGGGWVGGGGVGGGGGIGGKLEAGYTVQLDCLE